MSEKTQSAEKYELKVANMSPIQRKAFESLSEPARGATHDIARKLMKGSTVDIMAKWNVGKILIGMTQHPDKYGEKVVETVAMALNLRGTDDPKLEANYVYQLRQFGESYEEEEIKELLRQAQHKQHPLAMSHILGFLKCSGVTQRRRIESRCLKEKLTAQAVVQLIEDNQGKRAGGGRKPSAPRSPSAAAQQIISLADKLVRRMPGWDEALFAHDSDHSVELEDYLKTARKSLTQLDHEVTSRVAKIDKLLTNIHEGNGHAAPAKAGKTPPAKAKKAKKGKKRRPVGAAG